MVAQMVDLESNPRELVDTYLARVANGEDLSADETLELSRAYIDVHGLSVPRQGGYSAKMNPHLLAMDHAPNIYPPELKAAPSAAQLARMNSGISFEDDLLNRWQGLPGVLVVADAPTDADGNRTQAGKLAKEDATFEAYLDPTVRFIANARLGGQFAARVSEHLGVDVDDAERVSEPDAIELGPVMANGLRAMRFVDIKWHKTTVSSKAQPITYAASTLEEPFFGTGESIDLVGPLQKSDWMQLSHYYRHGESLHVVDREHSLWGAIIGKEEILVWSRLDEVTYQYPDPVTGRKPRTAVLDIYDRCFAKAMRVVANAVARNLEPRIPALTFPEWNTDVKESGWKELCLAELETFGDGGHVTLLPGVTPSNVAAFYRADFHDVGTLARWNVYDDVRGLSDVAKFVYQARVAKSGVVALNVGVDTIDLLPPVDIEVDFDYEASHVLYQRGVRVTGHHEKRAGVEMDTYDDFTGTDEGEARIFVQMWARFQELISEAVDLGLTIRFYHYTHYERTQDLALAEKYAGVDGVPLPAEVAEFYDSDVVVDLYHVLSRQLVWPTKSHSIKDIAKHVKFAWRGGADQNGDESTVWYDRALNDPNVAVREENISVLRIYNEDDVIAQAVLREWVRDALEAGDAGLPRVESLPAPDLIPA